MIELETSKFYQLKSLDVEIYCPISNMKTLELEILVSLKSN